VDGQLQESGVLEVAGKAELTVPLQPLVSGAKAAVVRLRAWYAPDTNVLTNARAFDSGSGYQPGDVIKFPGSSGGPGLWVALLPQKENGFGANYSPASVYKGYWAEITATNQATGTLLVTEVGVQLRPQEATWDGEDNFRADNPAGTTRPTDPLKVAHCDAPIQAGLFAGNLFAFGKAVALADGTMSTRWARAIDKKAAPLFEANVLDSAALRAAPSRLLTGGVLFSGLGPPRLLDSLDAPWDTPGRRYFVLADEWDVHASQTSISVVEIGLGATVTDPLLEMPEGVRITHQVYAYKPGAFTPYVRLTHGGGVRVRHT
jgi:hypothetical protein